MPAPAHDPDLSRDLDSILSAAAFGLNQVHAAYQRGQLTSDQIDWVLETRNYLAQSLADFEDGAGYGSVCLSATNAMRCYEQMASSIIEAVEAVAS